jgi:hypothetical protein
MSQFGDDRVEADAGRVWSDAELYELGICSYAASR